METDDLEIFFLLNDKIKWANALVTLPNTSDDQRTADVSFALMDVIDYCVENGIIETEISELPMFLEIQLEKVFDFLGDPLC